MVRNTPSPTSPMSSRQRRSSHSDTRRLSGVAWRGHVRRLSNDVILFDPRTAIDPHASSLKAWHQVLLFALVYECFLLPYAVAFAPSYTGNSTLPSLLEHNAFRVFYSVELLFLADFYVKLNTGYYENGNIHRDASRTRVKYLKSMGFMLDVVTIVPLAVVLRANSVSVPAWLEFHKFLRLWRVPQYFVTLEDLYVKHFVALKMIKVLVVTTFVAHALTCARVSFGDRSLAEADNLWLSAANDANLSPASLYLRSLFWTFGLLTGVYEAELPREPPQVLFTVLVLLAGFSLFSYLCAVFFVLSKSERTTQSAVAEARMNQLKHLLCYYHVPDNLQARAVEYVKRYYADAESHDREVVKLLCPSIANDIQVELLRETVAKIPLFKGCSMPFIVALTSLLEMVSLPTDFQLFATGDPGDCMYVVNSGTLHILVKGVIVRELSKGNFFGEVSVFSKHPRSATVVTTSYCTLYRLSRFHIERVLEGYPQYAEVIACAVEVIFSQRPGTATHSAAAAAKGTSVDEFLLTTLFQLAPDTNGREALTPTTPQPTASTVTGSRTLTRTRSMLKSRKSTGPLEAVTVRRKGEGDHGGKTTPTNLAAKKVAIVRSKSTLNVSIARREEMSAISRRSDRSRRSGREKGEETDSNEDAKQSEDPARGDYQEKRSPTYVPPPSLLKRRNTFMTKRELPAVLARLRGANRVDSNVHRTSTAMDGIQKFYDNLSRLLIKQRDQRRSQRVLWLVSKLALRKTIPLASRFRRVWLVFMQFVLLYNWILVPMQLGFVLMRDNISTSWQIQVCNSVADLMLFADLYITANLQVALLHEAQEWIIDPIETALLYIHSWSCLVDVLCVLPYWIVVPASWNTVSIAVLLRMPRLVRVWRLKGHYSEWNTYHDPHSASPLSTTSGITSSTGKSARMKQVVVLAVALCTALHVVACGYFGLTQLEGFAAPISANRTENDPSSHTAWLPSAALDSAVHLTHTNHNGHASVVTQQYTRALFFAATTLTTLGKTFEPQSDVQFLAAIACMVLGLVLSALLVDVVHTRFTAAALEQKEFLVTRAQIESFLRSQSAPPEILQRVHAFLDFWWSSHRGAIASDLLQDLPETIRREIVSAMCKPAVQTLSLLAGVRPVLTDLEKVFVDSVDFILYGQGEIIYRQGDYASGLFFLLDGEVCMITDGSMPRSVPKGGFFGTASLHMSESSVSYAERMTAISGCILLFVSRQQLHAMHQTFPTLSMALKALEKRIIDSKFARGHELDTRRGSVSAVPAESIKHFSRVRRGINNLLGLDDENPALLFDPDTFMAKWWPRQIAVVIVMQSLKIIYEISFGVTRVVLSEATTTVFEMGFAFDMLFRSRLGFYEYGNKIMDRAQMNRRYFRSTAFALDVIALVPLFMVNWVIGKRVELLNIVKLVRLIRVTDTLTLLEAQYLNRTLELRLVKIVYYTMILAHTLGCIWYSFGFADELHGSSWLPGVKLQHASGTLQYLSAIFWSFGVMSASTTSGLPETPTQSVFAVLTMVGGLGLFAYIVGTLTDVVELRGSNVRDFNAHLSSLRRLIAHFALPESLQDKLKTYVFFQRFHSITQEHILESYLPPSLLTDIRLVHLQPMMLKVAFLTGMESSVERMLVSQFLQVLVVKDQFVCRYGDHGSDMFFVFTGIIEVLVPAATLHRLSSDSATTGGAIAAASKSAETADDVQHATAKPSPPPLGASQPTMTAMKKVNELTAGSYFGEIGLFTSKPRTANVRARTSSVLYKLSRRSLELVFERYPEWKKRVLRIVSIQQEQQHLRNLYMAEQQHDETKMQTKGSTTAKPTSTLSALSPLSKHLSERFVQGSKRLVRRMSTKRDGASVASPPPSPPRSPTLAMLRASSQVAPTPIALRDNTASSTPPSTPPVAASLHEPRPMKLHTSSSTASTASKPHKPLQQSQELWIDTLLACTEVQSASHVLWLRVMTVATLFMALAVPYRVAFDAPYYKDDNGRKIAATLPIVTRVLEHVCEILFAWDIWMNWNLKESLSSMELYETQHRVAYQKQRRLLWDALGAFPIDHFLSDFYVSPWLRLNRCFKALNFQHYVDEIYRRSVRYELTRFVSRWLLFLVGMYWCACAYFVVARHTTIETIDTWYQWAPPPALLIDNQTPTRQLVMRLMRSFFFAVTAFVKKGKTFEPENESALVFTLVVSFVGLLTMAIMIGEVMNLYVSYISNEVDFRHHHIAVNKYLERWHVSTKLRRRAHAFLASLWSSHRGVNYQAILDDLPLEIRNEVVFHVASSPMEGFVANCLASFLPNTIGKRHELEALVHAIAPHLQYQGFPRDECIIAEGRIAKSMYFVVRGLLVSRSSTESMVAAALAAGAMPPAGVSGAGSPGAMPPSSLPRDVRLTNGDFFGERGLLGYAVSRCTVRTVSACDLFALTSEALLDVLLSRQLFQVALSIAVESYKEMTQLLRQKCDQLDADALDAAALLGVATPDEPWGDVLLGVIAKRQRQWQVAWLEGHMSATQYNLMSPMRELKQAEACRSMFDNLLRLILPHGSLYARVASVRSKGSPLSNEEPTGAVGGGTDSFSTATDFHENLPVMMSTISIHSEHATHSNSGSREMSSPRRSQPRSRFNTSASLSAKMLPPSS